MEGEKPPDPFSSTIKLSEATESQEEKLQDFPFARESEEAFSDSIADPMTESCHGWTLSEPPEGILMLSPPDSSDGTFDQNTPIEEDKYHTPPEQYYSFASDSDDPKQPPPPSGTTARGSDDDRTIVDLEDEENIMIQLDGVDGSLTRKSRPLPPPPSPGTTICRVDDDQVVEEAVHFSDEEKNAGLQLDSEIEGFDGNLKGKRLLSPLQAPPETSLSCGGNNQTMRAVNFGDEEENTGLLGLQLDQNSRDKCCDSVIKERETEVLKCELNRDGDLEGEFSENVCEGNLGLEIDTVSVDDTVEILDTETIDTEECDREQRVSMNVVPLEKDLRVGDGVSKGVSLCISEGDHDGVSEGITSEASGPGNLPENVLESDGISRVKRLRGNDEGPGELRKDNLSKSRDGEGVVSEAENVGSSGARALRKALETIEKFKYAGPSDGMDQREKTRKLPVSMIGAKKGEQREEEGAKEVAKGGSLMDITDTILSIIGKPDYGSEHDILETAKKRGVVFPRPRWWPPEGYD